MTPTGQTSTGIIDPSATALQATRDILDAIHQHRDDGQPIFDIILQSAARLCDAPLAGLALVNDARDRLLVKSVWGDLDQRLPAPEDGFALDSDVFPARAFRAAEVLHIADMKAVPEYVAGDPRYVALVNQKGFNAYLCVPLMMNGAPIGCLDLFRVTPNPFDDAQIALIETFAAQAVIAIENVRQFREVQRRLEREKASREILDVISQSRDDETPVFKAILERAERLCEATASGLQLVNEDRTRLRYVIGSDPDKGSFTPGETTWDLNGPYGMCAAVRDARVMHMEDMKNSSLYRSGDPSRVALVDVERVQTQLHVPLLKDGVAFGNMSLSRREAKPFTPDQIALVESFAAQAVIAIENVRQFREVQERLARERATSEILGVISRSRDDESPVFRSVLRNARLLCRASAAGLLLGRPDAPNLTLAALDDSDPSMAATTDDRIARANAVPMKMDPKVHVAAKAICSGEVVHIADLTETTSYLIGEPTFRTMVEEAGQRSLLSVPLIDAKGPVGAINLHRRTPGFFRDDEIALVRSFAAQAVIAIENVRQFKALETLNAELNDRVQDQVGEIERMGRLKRFLPAAVADAVVTSGDESMLTSHRAMVATLFCDMRGFTAFCEAAEPEETIEVLQTYHQEMSDLIDEYGGGVDQRAGDGIMVIFNDPIPVDDPAGDAVRLAIAMRARMRGLCAGWKRLGHRLGFGVGVSLGYATVGMVGSAGRFDYTASGTSVNTAARLCDMAADGEVLISPRVRVAVEGDFQAESRGEVEMKGIREPVEVFAVS